ncbi:MAG: Endo,4-beta-xylanase precursor [Gammaproteobacteria bacterium]|nr:Endo,4-beta-xylanase precursor [Gammaproteobacteria bacterium]
MMFRSAWASFCLSSRSRLIFGTAFLFALLFTPPVHAQVVAQYGFEDGTAQGWTSFNGAGAPVNSAAAAHSGTQSLLTATNSSGGGGPGIQLTNLVPGASYQITAYVLLSSGETATAANLTLQRSDPGCSGGTCYDTIGTYQVPVSDSGWVQVGGTYTVSSSETGLLLYAQLVGPTSAQSFYLDDVVINQIAGPPGGPQDNSGITTTFEDSALDGWSSRAGAALANSTADAHGGAHSLLVTNRVAVYDGPQISVSNKMYNGSAYSISVWVKLAPSATQADTLRLSLQTTLAGTTTFHTVVSNTAVPLGAWVQLSIPNYAMGFAYDPNQAFLYVESNSGTQSFYIDDFQLTFIPPVQIQKDIPSLFQTLSQYFPVGAAVDSTDLSGPHAELLTKHFNSIVSGNDMKWDATEPQEGRFTFATADAEVSFAVAHSMLIRGHNLVWATGAQTPAWVFREADGVTPLSASNPADVTLLTQRIQSHIMNEVQHFGSAAYVWDVINEPLDPNQSDCLAQGPFYQVLGATYLDIALRAARQYAPPGTQLFINDYSTTDPKRLACLVSVVARLRLRGVPIDGVGHEMHNHIDNPSPVAMLEAIELLAALFPHLHQQVTELDVSVYLAGDNTSNYGANGGSVPESLIAEQGWLYEKYFKVFRRLKGKLDAVTIWGVGDDNTWLDSFPIHRLDLPLPFDTRLQAKPAYWGIVDPTKLPGFGLSLALVSRTGPPDNRVWTVTATNPGSSAADATQITGFSLRQVEGRPCRPEVTPPSSYPVVLGDIAPTSTASAAFTIDFEHCSPDAQFILVVPWSSAKYETGTLVLEHVHP